MKRSEMIEVMLEASSTLHGTPIHMPYFEQTLIETLLTAIEQAGVLPEWEPENE